MKHLVGVVIPVHNRLEDLLNTLSSLYSQTFKNWFCIVVDNNSTDGLKDRLPLVFPDVEIIKLDKNLGASAASNIGIRRAIKRGAAFILRLDSDVVLAPDVLQLLIKAAKDYPNAGILSPLIYYYDYPTQVWFSGAKQHPFHFGAIGLKLDLEKFQDVVLTDYAWATSMLVRCKVIEQTGGFDPLFFVYYEDLDFSIRVRKLGWDILLVPQARLWHKVQSRQGSAWLAYQWNKSKMLLYKKHAKNSPHKIMLFAYAFLYALVRAFIHHPHKGNRGPFISALYGLWQGLREPLP